ncbi:MAG: class I adenylate-forming enzyme family protein [Myxococcota bacterium]
MNLMMLLEMASQGFGEREALRGRDVSAAAGSLAALGYAELFRAAGAAAAEIRAAGVEQVALLDVSSPAVPVALFGAAWAGVPFVPLNYRLTGAELDALIERVTPALLITDPERAQQLDRRAGIRVVSRDAFLERTTSEKSPDAEWSMDPEQIAILLFTSGTTGVPKAAVLRHQHLVSYILGSVEFGSAAESDAALVCVPPYHIAGMAAILSSVYSGRRIVQLASFTPEAWIEAVRSESITHAFVVPTMLARIVDAIDTAGGDRLPSLRALSYGGGKMPLAVIERAMRCFPDADFTQAYGLTETSSTIALLGPDDHRSALTSDDPEVRRRLTSVGRPLPGIEVSIRDLEGRPLGVGERGEVYVRGEQVAGEYLGRGSLLEEGWFPTRDGGFLDAEGYLFLDGRMDDVIVRGAENLSPGEIEDVLHAHPAVVDCAVVGVPSEQWGEAVGAAVVLARDQSATADELREWVRAHLRSSRVPERIEFRSELPYNDTGKLLRRQVREDLSEDPS